MTDTGTDTAKREKGPLAISFMSPEGESKRVPANPTAIRVLERKTGATKDYDLSLAIPQSMLLSFAAAGLKHVLSVAINNKTEDGTDIISISDDVMALAASGKIYTRDGTGVKTRKSAPFDREYWVEVLHTAMASAKKTVPAPSQVDVFIHNIESKNGRERMQYVSGLQKKNAHFRAAIAKVNAKRLDKQAKKAHDADDMSDLF